jgi:hypothetical protein
MPGYWQPNRRSINRISELWSKTWELTHPPFAPGRNNDHRHADAHPVRARMWLQGSAQVSTLGTLKKRVRPELVRG